MATYKPMPVRFTKGQRSLLAKYARKMKVSQAELIRQLVVERFLIELSVKHEEEI